MPRRSRDRELSGMSFLSRSQFLLSTRVCHSRKFLYPVEDRRQPRIYIALMAPTAHGSYGDERTFVAISPPNSWMAGCTWALDQHPVPSPPKTAFRRLRVDT